MAKIKIGLSDQDKLNMANDVYDRVKTEVDGYVQEKDTEIDGFMDTVTNNFNELSGQVEGTLGEQNQEIADFKTEVNGEIDEFEGGVNTRLGNQDTAISNINQGGPKGVYATKAALEAAYPTGTSGIYVVTGDGKWYYWDGTAWTDGGVYQATAIANGEIDNKHLSDNLRLETILNNANYTDKPFQEISVAYGVTSYVGLTKTLNGSIKISADFMCSNAYRGQISINGVVAETTDVKRRISVTVSSFNSDVITFRGFTSGATIIVSNINVSYVSENVDNFSINDFIDKNTRDITDIGNSLPKGYVDITSELNFNKNGFYGYGNFNWNENSNVKTSILQVYKGEQYRISGNSYYTGNLYLLFGKTSYTVFPNASNNNLYTNQVINVTEDALLIMVKPNAQSSNFKLEKYTYLNETSVLPTFDDYYERITGLTQSEGYITTSGTLDTYAGTHISISVLVGERYKVYSNHGSALRSYVLVDSDNNVVSYYPSGTISTTTDVVDVTITTNGTLYVNSYNHRLLEIAKYTDVRDLKSNNPIYNKSIYFFGDSITESHNSWANTFEIRLRNKMTTENCNWGVSGSQYCVNSSSTTENNINLKVKSITSSYDYCILSGGANDIGRNNTLGSLTSAYDSELDTSTFYGALEDTMRWLLKNQLNCKIGYVITPRLRNHTQQDSYVNAIKQVCEKYSIPYLDLCNAGGLTSVYDEITAECYLTTSDYYHPNLKGYKLLNNKVEQFIKTL